MRFLEVSVSEVGDGCILDPETNCLLWLGTLRRAGHPVDYPPPRFNERMVARHRWLRSYKLDLPWHTSRLRALCHQGRCVAPWHRCLKSPARILKREGIGSWRLSRLRGAFRERAGRDPSWPVTWIGSLANLSCAPYAVERLAQETDVAILVALSVYATLIPKEVT